MKRSMTSFMEIKNISLLVMMLLLVSFKVEAATTVTVDDSNRVQVNSNQPQPAGALEVPGAAVQPAGNQQVLVAVANDAADFEGEIERIDRSTRMIDVIDAEGMTRQVLVTQETLDTYRTGDFVQIHPISNTQEVAFVRGESARDLEGRIINVDNSQNTILVRDTEGRDRRIKLKQGMIGSYKVDNYVRIHLMADLKEAKMIRTIK